MYPALGSCLHRYKLMCSVGLAETPTASKAVGVINCCRFAVQIQATGPLNSLLFHAFSCP